MHQSNSVELPCFTIISPNNQAERFIGITKQKVEKLIEFISGRDISEDDFIIYLKECGLPESEISTIIEFYHNNYSQQIACLKAQIQVKKIMDKFKVNTNNNVEVSEESLYSFLQNPLKILNYNKANLQKKLEILSLLHDAIDDIKFKNEYEVKMTDIAKLLIKKLKDNKDVERVLGNFNDGLNNSNGKAELLFSDNIIKIIQERVKDDYKKLYYLFDGVCSASEDLGQDIFEKAMIGPSINIIEKTENYIIEFALEKLTEGMMTTQGEANYLFDQEIKYRSYLNSINSILLS